MDELLSEFLTESTESLAKLDIQLLELEKSPDNPDILNSIFRTMHTIKGTCGFINLTRLEKVAHAGENVLGKIRDGSLRINTDVISLVLECVDTVKNIVGVLSNSGKEPDGDDNLLIDKLNHLIETIAIQEVPEFLEVVTPEIRTDFVIHPEEKQEEINVADQSEADVLALVEEMKQEKARKEEATKVDIKHEEVVVAAKKVMEATPVVAKENRKQNSTAAVSDPNQTIRVNINTLENLINMVSELVLSRNQLMQIIRNEERSDLTLAFYRLNYVTTELQEQVMKTRMQPIGNAWLKLPRLVRDVSRELNKKIELEMHGEETELDRQVLELIKDPLTHMLRNSMDHGIEGPEERLSKGKPEVGKIRLNAHHEGGHIVIDISDDGRGLSIEKIKAKALENNLVSQENLLSMNENQIYQLIFKSGFSTAEAVTNISGRGVGMDVVRTNIEQIGGVIDIYSRSGKGTKFSIKIPLTLSIVSALITEIDGYRFAIPQLNILELIHLSEDSKVQIEYVHNKPVLRLRNKLLTLVNMKDLFQLGDKHVDKEEERVEPSEGKRPRHKKRLRKEEEYVIVLQAGSTPFGVIVNRVFDTQEIVVKPVSSLIRHISIFAGNTILGDGSVIMVLDVNHIARLMGDQSIESEESKNVVMDTSVTSFDREKFLIFKTQGPSSQAIPLLSLTRLEKINIKDVEYSNGKPCVQYRGALMPLMFLCNQHAINPDITPYKPALVFSNENHSMGLVVDDIVDIVESSMEVKLTSKSGSLLGTTVLNDEVTEILNADYYLNQEFSDWYSNSSKDRTSMTTHPTIVFMGEHFYGSNYLLPFLRIEGFHVISLETEPELANFFENKREINVDSFLIDGKSLNEFANKSLDYIQRSELYVKSPVIVLSDYGSEGASFSEDITVLDRMDRTSIIRHLENVCSERKA